MNRVHLVFFTIVAAPACDGRDVTPVSTYKSTVTATLRSDGKEAFVTLAPDATANPCPHFGARATLNGEEMTQVQFGGQRETQGFFESSRTYCDFGTYRAPARRVADATTSEVRIWDETGEITFTVSNVLTEPELLWVSKSELHPGERGVLGVLPETLVWEERGYLEGLGSDDELNWGTDASSNGSQLAFTVPESTPPGTGKVRVRYEWQSQLTAPVIKCNGALACAGELTLSEAATLPVTILPPD